MKKLLFSLTAAAVALLSSCAKEEAPALEEAVPGAVKITARIDNDATKTHYVEGASSAALYWNAGDRFKLMVYKNDEGKAANFYSFEADADAAGSEATFTIVSGSMDLTTYPAAGYAVYPNTLATGGVKDAYTVTLSGEYTIATGTDLSKVAVPMIGVPTDAADANTYVFSPAVGVLKVQLTHVPAAARKLVLKAVDTDNVSGVFPLDAANGFRMADATSEGHTVTVNFPAQADDSDLAVYMPIPAGTISAGAVFEVQDNAGVALHATPATVKAIDVAKGQLIPIKAINTASEWVTLGTGKFVDNFLWNHMGVAASLDNQEAGYIDVTIQQNVADNNKYRVVNPYGAILASLGRTQEASHSDFLEFTITDASNVDFVTTNTGYNSGAGVVSIEDVNGTNNIVILGTADAPEIVQLAPKYNSDGSFVYTRNGRENLIRIAFPGVYELHSASITIGKSDLSTGIDFTSTAYKTTIYVSSSPLYSFYSGYDEQSLPTTCSSSWDASGNKTAANMGVATALTTSGPQYAFWTTFATDGTTILFQGCQKIYFITEADKTAILGTRNVSYSSASAAFPDEAKTITLAVSNNPTSSNVMITEIMGAHSDITQNSSSVLTYKIDSGYPEETAYTTFGEYSASSGSPVKGIYTSSTGKILFSELANQTFFIDSYPHSVYLHNQYKNQSALSFTVNAGSDGTTTHRLSCDAGVLVLAYDLTAEDAYGILTNKWFSISGFVAD